MTDIRDWSTNPASNNASPPVGAPEGQTAGSVNNVMREMMSYLVLEAQQNRVKTLTSVGGTANAITASMLPALTGYVGGMIVGLTPGSTNSGATTLNINALGALPVLNIDGTACVGGELVSGIPAVLVLYSGATNWVIVNPNVVKSRGIETGYRGFVISRTITSGVDVADTDSGKAIKAGGTAPYAINIPSGLSVGDFVSAYNVASGNITLTAAGGVTLSWLNGSGAISTGTRTLAVGAYISIFQETSGSWLITGTGIS